MLKYAEMTDLGEWQFWVPRLGLEAAPEIGALPFQMMLHTPVLKKRVSGFESILLKRLNVWGVQLLGGGG